MQASSVARRSSAPAFIAIAVLGSSIIGGLGGYSFKSLDHGRGASSVTTLTTPLDQTNTRASGQSTRWLKNHD